MNTMAKWVVERPWLAWAVVLTLTLLSGWATTEFIRTQREEERLFLLQTDAERRGIEIMSQTLNGNIMGALGLLGAIDVELKREALGEAGRHDVKLEVRGKTFNVSPSNIANLESISRSYDAEGAFIVRKDGWIGSGWDNTGKPSTGLNVKFRPYYQMAMQGMENVYAAVSQARGDRMLYFSAPIYAENTSGTEAIGAVVARTGLLKIDHLLHDKADIALLLSPQDVVFASSKPEWVAHIAGRATPERLQSIRDIKQFGDLFVRKDPLPLPVSIESGIQSFEGKSFAIARAKVQWNDPLGDWTLVLMEDMSRTVPLAHRLKFGFLNSLIILVLGVLLLRMLRGHHAQVMATGQLNAYARIQQTHAERKSAIAAASLRLQQANSLDSLANTLLTELHALVSLMQGVIYIVNDGKDRHLRLAGSYGCSTPPAHRLDLGDGLLGQCALEQRQTLLDAPEGARSWQIHSGLGSTRPRTLLLTPILLADQLLGVMEAAFLTPLDEESRDTLAEMGKLLAMNIEIQRRSAHTQSLLDATVAAERASTAQARFQQVLVDTIPYPVFYKGPDARFLGVNQAYEQTFNVSRNDLVGKRVLDLQYLPEADRIAYQAEDERVIADASQVRHEMQIPLADGKLHDTLYFVSGFRDADGVPGGLVGTFIDISAQKEARENLERLADAERFNRLSQGREARVLQLKEEVNALCQRLSEPPRYAAAQAGAAEADDTDQPLGAALRLVRLNWHGAYDSGQAVIDREHHALFAIANELINAVVAGRTKDEIGRIVDRLAQETVQHFAHEEAILRAHGYPALDEHIAIHKALVERAVHLIGELKAGRTDPGPVFQFLAYDVIARHMLGEDRKFFPLFQSPGGAVASQDKAAAMPTLAELIDLGELQALLADFCASLGIASAIIDLQGNILASVRWQDAHCGSDADPAPIIVEGSHLANIFISRCPACALDETRTPAILSFLSGITRMISSMSLARRRADEVGQRLRQQAETLQQERIAAISLAEDARQARIAPESTATEPTA